MHHKCPAGLAGVTTAPAYPEMQGAWGKGPREGPNLRINRHIKSSRSFSSYFLKLLDRCTVTWQVTQRYTAMQCEETLWAVVDPGGYQAQASSSLALCIFFNILASNVSYENKNVAITRLFSAPDPGQGTHNALRTLATIAGALPQTPLGTLRAFPDPLAGGPFRDPLAPFSKSGSATGSQYFCRQQVSGYIGVASMVRGTTPPANVYKHYLQNLVNTCQAQSFLLNR